MSGVRDFKGKTRETEGRFGVERGPIWSIRGRDWGEGGERGQKSEKTQVYEILERKSEWEWSRGISIRMSSLGRRGREGLKGVFVCVIRKVEKRTLLLTSIQTNKPELPR